MGDTEDALLAKMKEAHLLPLWRLHTDAPERPKVTPHIWRWRDVRALAEEAGDLPELQGVGSRRALIMSNPGLTMPWSSATKTMTAAIQIVWPGEIATAHRHTAAAIRFVIDGSGAYTVQDGERFEMSQGDFTLTPSMVYHDHGNLTNRPMIWLDGLDAPMVGYFDAMMQEEFPEDEQPVSRPDGFTNVRVGNGLMRGIDDRIAPDRPLPITYKWDESYGALVDWNEDTKFDGVAMEYINPITGGHAMPTLMSALHRIKPSTRTQAHRHTSSVIYHVAKGSGFSIIDGIRIEWAHGDTFVLPPLAWHEHGNDSDGADAVLFSMSDRPVLEAMGIYREDEGMPQSVKETWR